MAAFTVNGVTVTAEKNQKLIRFLRDELRLTSVKDGCSEGACGTCTVLIDGKATRACIPQTDKLEGKSVLTVEGLSAGVRATDAGTYTVVVEGTPVVWFFEEAAPLREDMGAGRIPVSCNVLYDQMGALPEVTVTDPETIAELYNRLSQMIVLEGGRAMSITDSYHHIYFTLQDGTVVGWSFEGEGSLDKGSEGLYPVSDEGGLWSYVRELQDELG